MSVILGLTKDQTIDALSQAFVDGQAEPTDMHQTLVPKNLGPQGCNEQGNATSLAHKKGQIGYRAISAPTWGFKDVYSKEMN